VEVCFSFIKRFSFPTADVSTDRNEHSKLRESWPLRICELGIHMNELRGGGGTSVHSVIWSRFEQDTTQCKGKAVPLQAWSGPEGSRKLRFPDFMTTAQDSGKVVSLKHRPPLPPGNAPGTNFC